MWIQNPFNGRRSFYFNKFVALKSIIEMDFIFGIGVADAFGVCKIVDVMVGDCFTVLDVSIKGRI
jgi:hypothetical protein